MELIERYLHAVEFWLPANQKLDIVAELSEEIHSQIDEQETALGRQLTTAEVESILRQIGAPVLVANRYLPQNSLIGPLVFPIYIFVLKIATLGYLVPWVLVWIGLTTFSPGFRQSHGESWIALIGQMFASLWSTTFAMFAAITVAFAVLDRVQSNSHFLEKWDPRRLPAVRNPNQIPRANSILEIAVNLFAFVWWGTYMAGPIVFNHPHIVISVSDTWRYFFVAFLLMTLANFILAVFSLSWPYWTRQRALARLAIDAAGGVFFCWFMKAGVLTDLEIEHVTVTKAAEITAAINQWMDKLFPAAIVFTIVIAVVNVYRVFRINPNPVPYASHAPAGR